MKRYIKISLTVIGVFLLAVTLLLLGISIYADILNQPKAEHYIVGRVYGNPLDSISSDFSFKTYDSEGNQIRAEKVNIYSFGKFNIDFLENEKYFIFYRSSYSYKQDEYNVTQYTDFPTDPDMLIPIDEFNKNFFKYSLERDVLILP